MEDKKILILLSAHQDSPQKLSHCIDLISFLKKDGLDVCFSTHSPYGIDKISEVSDYTIFDSDNEFMDEYDLINNLGLIKDDMISERWLSWFSHSPEMVLKSHFASASHQKSAFSVLKNATAISESKGYKWTVYCEYDCSIPLVSFRDLINEKISLLENQNKKAFVLIRGKEKKPMSGAIHLISLGMLIYETSILAKNDIFRGPCDSGHSEWASAFGNMLFEEVVEYLLLQSGEDNIIYEDWLEFFDLCWGGTEKTNIFNAIRDRRESKKSSRTVASEYLKNSFFPYKRHGGYGVYTYSYNISDSISFDIYNMRIKEGSREILIEDFSVNPGSWYRHHEYFAGDIVGSSEVLFLEFDVKNSLDDYVHHFYQEVQVKNLDKFWKIRRYEDR